MKLKGNSNWFKFHIKVKVLNFICIILFFFCWTNLIRYIRHISMSQNHSQLNIEPIALPYERWMKEWIHYEVLWKRWTYHLWYSIRQIDQKLFFEYITFGSEGPKNHFFSWVVMCWINDFIRMKSSWSNENNNKIVRDKNKRKTISMNCFHRYMNRNI